jgi:hypothetical protein
MFPSFTEVRRSRGVLVFVGLMDDLRLFGDLRNSFATRRFPVPRDRKGSPMSAMFQARGPSQSSQYVREDRTDLPAVLGSKPSVERVMLQQRARAVVVAERVPL